VVKEVLGVKEDLTIHRAAAGGGEVLGGVFGASVPRLSGVLGSSLPFQPSVPCHTIVGRACIVGFCCSSCSCAYMLLLSSWG
jgi:hypothetical protein